MSYTLEIMDEARKQAEDAYNYYEDKRIGLGEEFLEELNKKYIALSKHPEYYSYIDNRALVRDIKIERFPYVIVFEIIKKSVVILYIHNTYRQLPEI